MQFIARLTRERHPRSQVRVVREPTCNSSARATRALGRSGISFAPTLARSKRLTFIHKCRLTLLVKVHKESLKQSTGDVEARVDVKSKCIVRPVLGNASEREFPIKADPRGQSSTDSFLKAKRSLVGGNKGETASGGHTSLV